MPLPIISTLYEMDQAQQQLNRDTVEEFREHCFRAPELRFWQALRNWSNYNFIYASNVSPLELDELSLAVKDTFYWRGKEWDR